LPRSLAILDVNMLVMSRADVTIALSRIGRDSDNKKCMPIRFLTSERRDQTFPKVPQYLSTPTYPYKGTGCSLPRLADNLQQLSTRMLARTV
jgi:hypothetical protein